MPRGPLDFGDAVFAFNSVCWPIKLWVDNPRRKNMIMHRLISIWSRVARQPRLGQCRRHSGFLFRPGLRCAGRRTDRRYGGFSKGAGCRRPGGWRRGVRAAWKLFFCRTSQTGARSDPERHLGIRPVARRAPQSRGGQADRRWHDFSGHGKRGERGGRPFIELNDNCTLKGVVPNGCDGPREFCGKSILEKVNQIVCPDDDSSPRSRFRQSLRHVFILISKATISRGIAILSLTARSIFRVSLSPYGFTRHQIVFRPPASCCRFC